MRPGLPTLPSLRGIGVLARCSRNLLLKLHRVSIQEVHPAGFSATDHLVSSRYYHRAAGCQVSVSCFKSIHIRIVWNWWPRYKRRREKRVSEGRQLDEAVAIHVVRWIGAAVPCQEIDIPIRISDEATAAVPYA